GELTRASSLEEHHASKRLEGFAVAMRAERGLTKAISSLAQLRSRDGSRLLTPVAAVVQQRHRQVWAAANTTQAMTIRPAISHTSRVIWTCRIQVPLTPCR